MDRPERAGSLEALVSTGVLSTTANDTYTLSPRFVDARERTQSSLETDGDEALSAGVARLDLPTRICTTVEVLRGFDPSLDLDTAVAVAWTLSLFGESMPTAGVPDGFVPVNPDEIEQFVSSFPAAVLYCWREECDPCDLVRADLESLVDDDAFPAWMGRAAVYGPDGAAELSQAYDVGGAPTLLFFIGSSVDCRFVGPKDRETVARELQTVAARAGSSETS